MALKIFFIITAVFIGWLIYRSIKHNPNSLSRENLGKSFYTLGILALLLMGFVALLIHFTR